MSNNYYCVTLIGAVGAHGLTGGGIVAIMPQAQYATLALARAVQISSFALPPFFVEFAPLYLIIMKNDTPTIPEYRDVRGIYSVIGGTSVTTPIHASGVTFTAAGTIAATNVQAALEELDTEKMPISGGTFTGPFKPMRWPPLNLQGANGFALGAYYNAVWAVAHSDTDAVMYAMFTIPIAGNYKVSISHTSDTAARTDNGVCRVGNAADGAVMSSTNLLNDEELDLVNTDAATNYQTSSTSAFAVAAGDMVMVRWTKNANDGTGTLHIFGIWLEVQ
jgi:uncharacterized protein YuzB (UPF0349 family)